MKMLVGLGVEILIPSLFLNKAHGLKPKTRLMKLCNTFEWTGLSRGHVTAFLPHLYVEMSAVLKNIVLLCSIVFPVHLIMTGREYGQKAVS